jgi:glutathione S-transferase kappa 1
VVSLFQQLNQIKSLLGTMATHRVHFFYDCLSPFSCLAYKVLSRYQHIWPIQLQLRPFLLGGVMAATKNQPPAMRPGATAAATWSQQDMERNRGYFHVPMLPIPNNFFGPHGPADKSGLARDMRYQRLLTAIQMDYPDALPSATDNIFSIIHLNEQCRDEAGNVVLTPEVLEKVCTSAGISSDNASTLVSKRINDVDVKDSLKHTTGEAVKRGAFGAPTIIVEVIHNPDNEKEQIYFGSDRFEQMCFANDWPWAGPDPAHPTAHL